MKFREYPKYVNGKIVRDSIEEAAEQAKLGSLLEPAIQQLAQREIEATNASCADFSAVRRGPGRPPTKK